MRTALQKIKLVYVMVVVVQEKVVVVILKAMEMAAALTAVAVVDSPYFPEPRPCSSLAQAIWARCGSCDKCCSTGECLLKRENPFGEWSTSTAIREMPTLAIPGNRKRRRKRRRKKEKTRVAGGALSPETFQWNWHRWVVKTWRPMTCWAFCNPATRSF